ncbi:MAG: L,D-transpeptidase [Actinomycetota bacterium]|nr:L,D-transpeptidase [Actinomycetota bacterium]
MKTPNFWLKVSILTALLLSSLLLPDGSAQADVAAVKRLFGKKFFSQEIVEIIEGPLAKEPVTEEIEEIATPDTKIARVEVKNVRKKSGQTISAYNAAGELLFESPCSAGKRWSTPIGTFKFVKQKPRLYSYNLQLYANYPSYFGKHLAIHAWPIVIRTKKLYQINKLGSPASIGCIRIPEEFAKEIHENIDLKTTKLIISA